MKPRSRQYFLYRPPEARSEGESESERESVCVERVCVERECVGGYSIEEGPGRRFDDKHRRRFTVTGTATRCEHLARE